MSDTDVVVVGLIMIPILLIFVTIMDRVDNKRCEQRRREVSERMNKRIHGHRLEGCEDMAKEKKLTREQRRILSDHGIEDTSTWVYLGTEVNDHRGCKSLSRNEPKEVTMTFKDTSTGKIENIVVQG